MRVRRLPPVSVPSRQGRRADKGADAAVQRRIRGADVAGFVLATYSVGWLAVPLGPRSAAGWAVAVKGDVAYPLFYLAEDVS